MFGEATMKLIWVFHNDLDSPFEGLGVAAASRLLKGTMVMHCHGEVVSKPMSKKPHGYVCSYLMNADGTGCAIHGPHIILFNREELDFDQIHQAPVPMMPLSNSLKNCKELNCHEIVDHKNAREWAGNHQGH